MRSREQDASAKRITFSGAVNSDGTIRNAGTGNWRCIREGVGVYAIYPLVPVAVASADVEATSLTATNVTIPDRPGAYWRVTTRTISNTNTFADGLFSFSVTARAT